MWLSFRLFLLDQTRKTRNIIDYFYFLSFKYWRRKSKFDLWYDLPSAIRGRKKRVHKFSSSFWRGRKYVSCLWQQSNTISIRSSEEENRKQVWFPRVFSSFLWRGLWLRTPPSDGKHHNMRVNKSGFVLFLKYKLITLYYKKLVHSYFVALW